MSLVYAPLLISSAAFLVSVISLFFFRAYLKRRTGQERILSEIGEEVNNILKSIDETTDRDISLIEEREKNLKSLLEEIDKRLKVYIRETEKRRDADDAYAALSPGEEGKARSAPPGQSSARNGVSYQDLGKRRFKAQARGIQEAAESGTEGEKTGSAFPLPRFRVRPEFSAESGASGEKAPPPLSAGEQIRELILAGFTPPMIASRLGISIAEVEFAAALLERRTSK